MPGRLRSSFRSGNLAEDFGLLLLKGIAAVAEVSRTEDVGLDAVASLLRPAEDGNCYAEDSFVVQLKTESTNKLTYKGHALEWLVEQKQPMFIGLVSLKDSRISLYPTINVNAAALFLHATRLVVQFRRSGKPPFLRDTTTAHWGGENVWLGEPLLSWTLANLCDPQWPSSAYEILKCFLPLARTALDVLALGQASILEWSTNDLNSIRSLSAGAVGSKESLASFRERIASICNAIIFNSMHLPGRGPQISDAVVSLASALRNAGIEIDPQNLFPALASMASRQPMKKRGPEKT